MTQRWWLIVALIGLVSMGSVLGQGLPTTRPEAAGLSEERLDRLTQVVQTEVDKREIPGVVALIARHGKVAYFRSFGMADREAGRAMSKDSLFRIASMSKPVTSVAVMILYEEGRLLLTDPVEQFIPEFKDPKVLVRSDAGEATLVPAKRPITIRNLLNHTSGITYGDGPHAPYYQEAGMTVGLSPTEGTIGEMVKKLAALPLICQPGDEMHYGMSTDVLGYLVEVVSGMPFDEFCRKRIFEPLGMKDTCFVLPSQKLNRLARTYRFDPDGRMAPMDEDLSYLVRQTYFSGGAGLVSSASDYVRFAQTILNKGQLEGTRILSPQTVELMTSNSIGDLYIPFRIIGDKFGYGFGIRTERGQYDELEPLGIFGWDGAFYTRFWIDPRNDLIAVFMSQVDNHWADRFAATFRVMVYQAVVE